MGWIFSPSFMRIGQEIGIFYICPVFNMTHFFTPTIRTAFMLKKIETGWTSLTPLTEKSFHVSVGKPAAKNCLLIPVSSVIDIWMGRRSKGVLRCTMYLVTRRWTITNVCCQLAVSYVDSRENQTFSRRSKGNCPEPLSSLFGDGKQISSKHSLMTQSLCVKVLQ